MAEYYINEYNSLPQQVDINTEKIRELSAIIEGQNYNMASSIEVLQRNNWTKEADYYVQFVGIPNINDHSFCTVVPRNKTKEIMLEFGKIILCETLENNVKLYCEVKPTIDINIVVWYNNTVD